MDGLYADPYGRCTNYFQCQAGVFQQYSTCDLGIFDPLTQRCVVSAELTVRPCGLQVSSQVMFFSPSVCLKVMFSFRHVTCGEFSSDAIDAFAT